MSNKIIEKRRQSSIRFNEREINLVISTMDKIARPIEFIYYLMGHDRERSFVLIFISGDGNALENTLKSEKRDTDLLYLLDKEKNLFALICQETKVDGGFRFAERILKKLAVEKVTEVYCSEIEIRSTKYPIQEIIFKGIENYKKAKYTNKVNEIQFYSLA